MKKYFYIKTLDIPIYRGKLVYIISNDVERLKINIPKFSDNEIYAHTYFREYCGKQGFYIILNFSSKYRNILHGTIAHECLHATNFILRDRGLELSVEGDEAQAYLLDYIVDKLYEFVKKNNFTVV